MMMLMLMPMLFSICRWHCLQKKIRCVVYRVCVCEKERELEERGAGAGKKKDGWRRREELENM